MCTVSMVYDHYNEPFKKWTNPYPGSPFVTPATPVPMPTIPDMAFRPIQPAPEIAELRNLIREFREAVEAAKKVDRLTNQPDCFDPKKATLEERVAELERRLAQIEA